MKEAKRDWYLYQKRADFSELSEKLGIDPVTVRILRNRELHTEEEIRSFLSASLSELPSPLLLPDAIRFANILNRALAEKKRIRIVGDYDVDGVCAAYILYRGLSALSENLDYEIPDRIRDGYGINREIIRRAKEDGVGLILTCDNGISAREELSYAKELGIPVLVTDHHDIPRDSEGRELLPEALAVVDPKREGSRYPFPEICGAVVAWKLLLLLYQMKNIAEEEGMRLLPFAAIATVCDVMPLREENRILVKYGLQALSDPENPGLRALLSQSGLSGLSPLRAYHLGFVLGPCINAGGRLESAKTALRLFLSESPEEAEPLAQKLKELNEQRKAMTKQACEEAFRQAEEEDESRSVLLLYLPKLHESLAGIVAGRVRERYYRPSFIVTRAQEEGMAKGSGRSIEGYPMADKLAEQKELLERFGGHPMAAGFSLREDKIGALRFALNRDAEIPPEKLKEKLWIDAAMPFSYVTEKLITELSRLEPFGKGNEKPRFAERALRILSVRVLGQKRNAVKFLLLSGEGRRAEAILFSDGDRFLRELGEKRLMDIVYYPEIHEYNGRKSLQLIISDYRFREESRPGGGRHD